MPALRRKGIEAQTSSYEITTFQAKDNLDFDGVVNRLRRRRTPIVIFIRYRVRRTDQERRVNAIKVEDGVLHVKSSTGTSHVGSIEKRSGRLFFTPISTK